MFHEYVRSRARGDSDVVLVFLDVSVRAIRCLLSVKYQAFDG